MSRMPRGRRTPEQAGQRWAQGLRALQQLGYQGQEAALLLIDARARGGRCACCGAPYRPDPRFLGQCAYCGAREWRGRS